MGTPSWNCLVVFSMGGKDRRETILFESGDDGLVRNDTHELFGPDIFSFDIFLLYRRAVC